MIPRGAKPMSGAVQDMVNSTTLSRYAGARVGRCQRMTKDEKQVTTCATMTRTKRHQHWCLTQ